MVNSMLINCIVRTANANSVKLDNGLISIGQKKNNMVIVYIKMAQAVALFEEIKYFKLDEFTYCPIYRYKSIKVCNKCKNIRHLESDCNEADHCIRCGKVHVDGNFFLGAKKFTCRTCLNRFGRSNLELIRHRPNYVFCGSIVNMLIRDRLVDGDFNPYNGNSHMEEDDGEN